MTISTHLPRHLNVIHIYLRLRGKTHAHLHLPTGALLPLNGRTWATVSFSRPLETLPLRLRVVAPVGATLYKTHHPPRFPDLSSVLDKHHRTPLPCTVQQTAVSHPVPAHPARL